MKLTSDQIIKILKDLIPEWEVSACKFRKEGLDFLEGFYTGQVGLGKTIVEWLEGEADK